MSDETPTPPADEAPAEAVADAPAEVAVPDAAHPAVAAAPAERRTVFNTFLMPLLVPLAVAAVIIFFVLNISRIFLANSDTIAVIVASIVTVLILGAGTAFSASPKVRSSSLTLMICGGLLVLLVGGMITIGQASPSTASGPVQCTPVTSKVRTIAGANSQLKFTPNALTAKAGCVQVTVTFDGSHTLQFTSGVASNVFPTLNPQNPTWAGTLPAGKYPFECTIPGHATAGMVGTLTVT